MSDDIAISVKGLGKKYTIGKSQEHYLTLRDAIVNSVKAPFQHLIHKNSDSSVNEFWALKDVSFDVYKGEVVGIIGRNGAGKSTLLKILSRITTPTEGCVELYGRVGSLLEVGTGFHPELTGRENAYLSGSIIGMKKKEIDDKFDAIVKFAEIEKFLDTPVKRYSSGMYVRLAFAVAAHLDPEILVVDEVLAVGDAEFQKKCLGKMGDVAKEGRTVLFVSHNMGAVNSLCQRTIWINYGKVRMDGETSHVVASYLNEGSVSADGIITEFQRTLTTWEATIQRITLLDENGEKIQQVFLGQPFQITLGITCKSPINDAVVELGICSQDGTRVITSFSIDEDKPYFKLSKGYQEITVKIKQTILPNEYSIDAGIHQSSGKTIDWVERALRFTALGVSRSGADCYPPYKTRGYVRPIAVWEFSDLAPDSDFPQK